jgi:transaldolase
MAQALDDLADGWVSVWLDDLSRPRIPACMVDGGEIIDITTNPTIFATAIGAGPGYEEQLCALAHRGTAIETAASGSPPYSPLMQLRWN